MKSYLISLRASRFSFAVAVVAAFGLVAPSVVRAAAVTSWTQYSGSISSGLGTASPTLGNGTAGSADGQTLYASLADSYTLSAVGDSITLSGEVSFLDMATPQADQFRIGLYDVNGQSGATGWLGYYVSNSGTSGGPTYSRLWERDNPNAGSFGSGAGATQISSANASPSNTAFTSGSYSFSLTYTLTGSGLDLTWSIIGTDLTYSVSGNIVDTTPETLTFDRVGIFTGGGLDAGQASFSGVDVTYVAVPEPALAGLLVAFVTGMLTIVRRRRIGQAA